MSKQRDHRNTGLYSNIEILRMCGNHLPERWKDPRINAFCQDAEKETPDRSHIHRLDKAFEAGPVITALWKAEAERSCSQGKPGLQGEFRASMGKFVKPCLGIKSKKRWDEVDQCRAIA